MKFKDLLNTINVAHKNIGCSKPYICGGIPRDKYMNKLSNIDDLDITTGDNTIHNLSIETFRLLKNNFNVQNKYYDDGHSSIFLGNLKIDFSSNFKIPNIENILIKKNILNPTNIEKEFFSRDFTCNALVLDTNLKNIIDITKNGFKDIDAKVIKTCLEPEISLLSNQKRVIRSVYLASKLDFNIDNKIVKFVSNNINLIQADHSNNLIKKLDIAFNINPDKASWYLSAMKLWDKVKITDTIYPYYMRRRNA